MALSLLRSKQRFQRSVSGISGRSTIS